MLLRIYQTDAVLETWLDQNITLLCHDNIRYVIEFSLGWERVYMTREVLRVVFKIPELALYSFILQI